MKVTDFNGTEIRVNDYVKIRKFGGGFRENDLGIEGAWHIETIDPVRGVQIHYRRFSYEPSRRTWFHPKSLVKVETILSVNDCYWTGDHDQCSHAVGCR